MKDWFKKGEHWIWFSASAVSISVVLVFGLLLMISYKGLIHFWAHDVYTYNITQSNGQLENIVGELHDTKLKEFTQANGEVKKIPQFLMKVGNRDIYGIDFRWINTADIVGRQDVLDDGVTVIERTEWGNVYGHLVEVRKAGAVLANQDNAKAVLMDLVDQGTALNAEIAHLEKVVIGGINYKLEQLRLTQKKLEAKNAFTAEAAQELADESAQLNAQFKTEQDKVKLLYQQSNELGSAVLKIAGGQALNVPIKNIVRFWQPNNMNYGEKVGFFFSSIGHFLLDDPREANTEGGVLPAIVGTITMVMLMAILVTPMGVIAAIYMSEYAKDGTVLRLVRISINNLAGVPSIVFGIFGLGFFVYIIGGSIDDLFFSYALPSPTFGTPGLLWAALTMALLTLPVVIVSTQEGLSRIPRALREGGLALGATKSETIMRIVLPMATPAIMTGLILAIARAAGEVAPLMLVGVVKLAPALPIDLNTPFIHLDRKFMHLGFHIYDVGFQSPNVEASQPLVYATSLLLVLIIVGLNLGAITIRNRLREKYKSLDN
ncbi:phosphate ABC transporter permease PstA [Thiosulfativibrio zosterae]|uniref:Phosphate transport system permease protein PstA n=1 Tax=Thiosulfativibrio zosterae TaxID=2675053 RepID=A0A6F8PL99_9GAMM|nr:phosphate ABC transporter permease PstA [Thiosulfativibrio zosterae]BBP42881.1 phosphate transport system permease protein PstA [Thiosulfativibrio zosterae]